MLRTPQRATRNIVVVVVAVTTLGACGSKKSSEDDEDPSDAPVVEDGVQWSAEPIAAEGAPSARRYHTAVWTGTEMLISVAASTSLRAP